MIAFFGSMVLPMEQPTEFESKSPAEIRAPECFPSSHIHPRSQSSRVDKEVTEVLPQSLGQQKGSENSNIPG